MNFRTTAVLFIILVAVGLLVLLTRDSGQSVTTEPTAAKLLALAPADVTKVSITTEDGKRIVLDRADGKWRLTEPVKAPAEETVAGNLVSAITGLETRGKIAADASTGFDAPRYKIELTTKDKTIKLDVGSSAGTGGNMYVRLDGASRADVVPASLEDVLAKPVKEWRRARLFDTTAMDIKQIRIATTQQSITLEKHGADWKMTQPSEMPADTAAVTDLTMALANLRAVDFTTESSENAGRYGLEQPVMTASFSTDAPTTQPSTSQPALTTIKFGRYDDVLKRNTFAAASSAPGVVTVASATLDSFKKKPIDLRDKRVLDINPEKVTRITISTDKPATTQPTTREASSEKVVLERAKIVLGPTMTTTAPSTMPTTAQAATQPAEPASKWNVASKGGADADDSKVDQLFADLHPLRAEKFLEAAPEMKGPTEYTLTIESTDATHVIKINQESASQPPVASYNGLTFNLNTFFLTKLEGDFIKGATAPTPLLPSSPFPPGAFPPGAFPQ